MCCSSLIVAVALPARVVCARVSAWSCERSWLFFFFVLRLVIRVACGSLRAAVYVRGGREVGFSVLGACRVGCDVLWHAVFVPVASPAAACCLLLLLPLPCVSLCVCGCCGVLLMCGAACWRACFMCAVRCLLLSLCASPHLVSVKGYKPSLRASPLYSLARLSYGCFAAPHSSQHTDAEQPLAPSCRSRVRCTPLTGTAAPLCMKTYGMHR